MHGRTPRATLLLVAAAGSLVIHQALAIGINSSALQLAFAIGSSKPSRHRSAVVTHGIGGDAFGYSWTEKDPVDVPQS